MEKKRLTVSMPVMNGYEAASSLRRSNHEDDEEAMAAGMNGHIAKPIDIGVLFKTISELLR